MSRNKAGDRFPQTGASNRIPTKSRRCTFQGKIWLSGQSLKFRPEIGRREGGRGSIPFQKRDSSMSNQTRVPRDPGAPRAFLPPTQQPPAGSATCSLLSSEGGPEPLLAREGAASAGSLPGGRPPPSGAARPSGEREEVGGLCLLFGEGAKAEC